MIFCFGMLNKLERELAVLPENFLSLITVPTHDRDEAATLLVRELLKKRKKGCYITAGKPVATLAELFALNGVTPTQLIYIDCVSAESKPIPDTATVHYVRSPRDLSAIGIQMGKIVSAKPQFIIIDSVNALLLHNSRSDVLRFLHSFTGVVREHKLAGAILSLAEDSDAQLLAELEQLCDGRIEL